MAGRTNFYVEVLTQGRAGFKCVAAVASHLYCLVPWMYVGFHWLYLWGGNYFLYKARDDMRNIRMLQPVLALAVHRFEELRIVLRRA